LEKLKGAVLSSKVMSTSGEILAFLILLILNIHYFFYIFTFPRSMIIVVLGDGMKESETLKSIMELGLLFNEFYSCECPKQKELIITEIHKIAERINPQDHC
jgi:hypothetical protein